MATIRCKSITFQNIQAIIFDKDGTLADSATFLRNLGQRRSRLLDAKIPGVGEPLLMAFGFDQQQLNPAGLLSVGTRRENEIAAAAYVAETGRDWIEALAIVQLAFQEADVYMQGKAAQTPLFQGGLDLLQRLKAKFKVGILSSDTTENVQAFVQCYQLEPYVDLAMGVDAGLAKPDPLLLYQACRALAIAPEQTLIVGDSQADIDLARAGGAAGCIGVTWGWTTAPQLSAADVVISQFDQIQIVDED